MNKQIHINGSSILFVLLIINVIFLYTFSFIDNDFLSKNYAFIIIAITWSAYCLFKTRKPRLLIDELTFAFILALTFIIIRNFSLPIKIHFFYFTTSGLLYLLFRYKQFHTKILNHIIAIICIIQSIYGLAQLINLLPNPLPFPIIGTFDNPEGFSICVSIGYPFLLSWIDCSKNRMLKLSCLIVIGSLLLSQSRTGILSFTIITIIFIIQKNPIFFTKNKRLITIIGSSLISLLFILLLFAKFNSTLSRVFILKISSNLCLESPLIGAGFEGFNAKYMEIQAKFFQENTGTGYEMLADVTSHPYNEFLLILIQYGLLGILFLSMIIIALSRTNIRYKEPYLFVIIIITIHSLFSYPFRYSFTWICFLYCLAQISKHSRILFTKNIEIDNSKKTIISFILIATFFFTVKDIIFEYKWKNVYLSSQKIGVSEEGLQEYEYLKKNWNGNPYFLYNYASELNYIGMHKESLEILSTCENHLNNYYIQMQIADNYYQLEIFEKAEDRYKLASNMCPNRFLPMQGLLRTYDKSGKHLKAQEMASQILTKKVKIPSYTVSTIKAEAKDYLHISSLKSDIN